MQLATFDHGSEASSKASINFSRGEIEGTISQRFEAIVRCHPDRIAIKTSTEAITYSQLNAMANRAARAIVERRGIEAEAIAILLENGPRLMAAMLAVLKAGKFFVILDSSFPKARNLAVIEDSQADLVITDHEHVPQLGDMLVEPERLLEFDFINSATVSDDCNLCVSPQSFAAIVYTSGSTGEPKGIVWNHQDILHRIMLRTIENRACAQDRIALLPTGTANAVTHSFLPLLNGGMLCPFPVQREGVIRLAEWLENEGITICSFSASLFRSFTAVLTGKEKFSDLRIVRLRSETVHKSDFELFKKHFPDHCAFVTGLSCSEAGQLTTYLLRHDSDIPEGVVPIGYPMQDKEILLLDDAGNEVGINQIGEIVVSSRYLAVGYWRRPELTASKFRADPNGSDQRICFTGDLGLRRPDGCIVHKGRKDFRVKIRGYGVELAEVEKRLLSHSGVREAVVVARQNGSDDSSLVAYYTGAGNPLPSSENLRDFLRANLPEYMIPATFVPLDAMPLTPNGKVDRRALPDSKTIRRNLAASYVASRNEMEGKLIAIWEDVLDIRPIGVNDGFFDLGGDSLSATRVISQVIDHFQLEIPLQLLLQSPTIADMAAVVARRQGKLSGNNKAIDAATASSVHTFADGLLPLSYSQQRLWFLDQLDPGSFTYNLFSAYRLKGDLNVSALEQSFNEIIRRHEVLRTVFQSEGGNPVQVVLSRLAIKIPIFDLRTTISEEDRWTEAYRMVTEEAQRPFDLATGPLLRITLLQLADDEYVLLRAMHHIVSDGWSAGVLFRELSEIYGALLTGKPSPIADLPMQYADYTVWQKQWLQGERLESQLLFWKKQLENIATLQFPTDRPRRPDQASRGARHYFALSDTLSSELEELSHQHGVTLFMTLLAAFQTLLHRYSGQTDIVIGSPVAGRSRREFEELIGFFLNTVVLRLDVSGDPTFAEVLRRAKDVCLGALSHQEVPFERLVEELHPDRNLGQNPLFQVSFAFQNTPRLPLWLSGITAQELEVDTGIARFDLHLFMAETDGNLKGYFHYDTDLFHPETIERLIGHFRVLLETIVAKPGQPISGLPLLSEVEKHQLLVEWNDTRTEYSTHKCIHELFEAQVEKTPGAVAVVFEDRRLTYTELNNRANQLAHYLRKLGVGPGVFVGICLDRSPEMIVALLGVLKAGGAYVPLDSSYPEARLEYMLKDAGVAVLLSDEEIAPRLPQYGGRIVCLNQEWQNIDRESTTNLFNEADARDLAYVIYTSGSTGHPKGVMIPHSALLNHMMWMLESFPLSQHDRVAQRTAFSFDASVWEFFAPLISGAELVLARTEGVSDAEYLVKFLEEERITILQVVPTLLQMLLEQNLERCTNLRRVFCGGEPLSTALSARFRGQRAVPLINLYGPSEATIDATSYACSADESPAQVPIGRPIANARLYILDRQLQPVPSGVAGEIHIGGAGLARGYLNSPELTAEEFIPDLFSGEPGSRLYRTGDLGRYRSDGNIEFVGRIDHQVKLRGYRIELGEIETALGQHPSVRQCAAAVREEDAGDQRLVAYVASQPEIVFDAGELREWLKRRLPAYMIPWAWVRLDDLPLLPNGKIDRAVLPVPDQDRPELGNIYQAPRTPVEDTLAGIWAEVLKVDKIGIYDNFFDLGGHSLLATQIMSRIRSCFSIELPLRTLFESPTIEQMAAAIMEHQMKQSGQEEPERVLFELESPPDEKVHSLVAEEDRSTSAEERHE